MALKFEVETLDDIPEAHKSLYSEQGGKFRLSVDGLEDTSGLKSALAKERKAHEEKAKQAAKYQSLGKSPEEIEALLDAQAKTEEEKATKAGEWDKLRAQMNSKHETELKAKDSQVSGMKSALERHLIGAQATAAIAAAKGVPDLLLPHVQKHVRVVDTDGDYAVTVVDARGDPRVNGKGEPLTISDLVAEMKSSDIYGRAFDGSGQSGSGKVPANGGGGGSKGNMGGTRQERLAAINAKFPNLGKG